MPDDPTYDDCGPRINGSDHAHDHSNRVHGRGQDSIPV